MLRVYRVLLTSAASPPPPLLKGLRVLELASVLAGPSVGQFLGELGAEVIKVENPKTKGDVTRIWKIDGETAADGRTAYFHAMNLNKKSVAIDVKSAAGNEVVQRLAASSDVVLASYKPGDAQKMGVDYATLSAKNPKLVYGIVTGYGQEVRRAGYDAAVQAECGLQYVNGDPETEPTKLPVPLVDILAAHQLKQALLLALWQRDRTGLGSEVHVSLIQAGVATLANQATNYLKNHNIPERMGSDHPTICPYGTVLTARDGLKLTLAVGSNKQYRALCEELGVPVLPEHERNQLRVKNRASCQALISGAVAKRDRDELIAALTACFVPCGAVNTMDKVFQIPQAQDIVVNDADGNFAGLRQSVADFHGPAYEAYATQQPTPLLPPPTYGQHTREVLMQAGYTEEEVAKLVKDEAVVVGSA